MHSAENADLNIVPDAMFLAILRFWEGRERNSWLKRYGMDLYVRRSKRLMQDNWFISLDLANFQIYHRSRRGKDTFTELLEKLEAKKGLWEILYVENVLEKNFQEFFEKRQNWQPCETIFPAIRSYWFKSGETR